MRIALLLALAALGRATAFQSHSTFTSIDDSEEGFGALHDAITDTDLSDDERVRVVTAALDAGASLYRRDALGYTPLHRASEDGETAVVDAGSSAGAVLQHLRVPGRVAHLVAESARAHSVYPGRRYSSSTMLTVPNVSTVECRCIQC